MIAEAYHSAVKTHIPHIVIRTGQRQGRVTLPKPNTKPHLATRNASHRRIALQHIMSPVTESFLVDRENGTDIFWGANHVRPISAVQTFPFVCSSLESCLALSAWRLG
jgi:hypothetical protein